MRASAADEPEAPSRSPSAVERVQHQVPMARAVCPYLEVSGARWRNASPSRDHRCQAIASAPPLTTDKQRRLCLGPAHVTCASYLAAMQDRRSWAFEPAAAPDGDAGAVIEAGLIATRADILDDGNRWGLSRTAPVVSGVSTGTHPLELIRHRAVAQVGLVGLLVVAFIAIAVSRGPGDGSSGALLVPTASATAAPTASPTAAATPSPTPTITPTAAPTSPPTPPPGTPTPAATTYRVVAGDTLSGIAGRYGTTVKAIMELNGLTSTTLRIGQQLLIPVKAGASAPAATTAASPASGG